jgi:hypothetical protein
VSLRCFCQEAVLRRLTRAHRLSLGTSLLILKFFRSQGMMSAVLNELEMAPTG